MESAFKGDRPAVRTTLKYRASSMCKKQNYLIIVLRSPVLALVFD